MVRTKIIKIFKSKGIQLTARLILGIIFIYASIDKIAFPAEFAKIIKSYNILPDFFVVPTSFVLPWIELIFGIFLVIGLFVNESALVLTSFLAIFLIAIIIRSTKGPIEDCGCFGNISFLFGKASYFKLIIRDLFFMLAGAVVIFDKTTKSDAI